jgi:integrase
VAWLRAKKGVTALALEFTIRTAVRTSEALGAQFNEFNLAAKVWTISAERIKAEKEHGVPLAPRAVAIVKELPASPVIRVLRPQARPTAFRSGHAADAAGHAPSTTVHGFRSTFKDWSSEMTSFPDHVSEAALAHAVADKARAAYARSDYSRSGAN